jgi:hemolysin activation/secretion protein
MPHKYMPRKGCGVSTLSMLAFAAVFAPASPSLAAQLAPTLPRGIANPLISQQQQPEERFLQNGREAEPLPTERKAPVLQQDGETPPQSIPPSGTTEEKSENKILVKEIRVVGNTVYRSGELQSIINPFITRWVGIEELRAVADKITNKYVDAGYITSRAVLTEQQVQDGVVIIDVIEGRLEPDGIKITGASRLHSYVRSRVALGTAPPLRVDRIEDQLILLSDDPLIASIKARLLPGANLGQSVLQVEVKEANPFYLDFSADNYSPPVLGAERYGGEIGYGNVFGLGDGVSLSYKHTSKSNSLWDARYRLPLNAMNGTFEIRGFFSRAETTSSQQFNFINQGVLTPEKFNLTLKSDYDYYEGSFRQPVIRTPRQELAFSAGFSYRKGFPLEALEASGLPSAIEGFLAEQGLETGLQQLGLLAPDLNQDKTSVIKFGADYLARDRGGVWSVRSQFNIGTGLFDATTRPKPLPDGQFFSWLFQAQRVQRVWVDNYLILSADLQLAADPLLASEQFVIGGGPSVRGYQQNIRFGDNGYRFSGELRIPILKASSGRPTLQLAPFVDAGQVWNNPNNPVPLPAQTFLIGLGAGIIWTPVRQLAVRLDAAAPIVNLEDRGNNMQDNGLYFSVNFRP